MGAPLQSVDIDACEICHISEGSTTSSFHDVKKGLENQMKFCKKFNHTGLEKHLERQKQLHESYRKIKLHKNCQWYVYNENKKRPATIVLLPNEKTSKILRSSMETFDWRRKCMFCCRPCQKNIRHPTRNNCHDVTWEQVLLSSQKRNDQINKEVASWVRSCNDLVAMEARYHTSYRITFMNLEKTFYPEKKMWRSLLGG